LRPTAKQKALNKRAVSFRQHTRSKATGASFFSLYCSLPNAQISASDIRGKENPMSKFFLGALLFIAITAPAAAAAPVGVPAPEMGEGALGMLLAAGAVYLIKRRGR
jgi:hypothetical protein